jgi:hypothetical protein
MIDILRRAPRPTRVGAIVAGVLALAFVAGAGVTYAAAMAQSPPPDVSTAPIMVAILALLAIPAVTSGVAALLRRMTDGTGLDPRVVVYAASVIITGLLVFTGRVALPDWTGDPGGYMLAWMAWLTANAEIARRVYETLQTALGKGTPTPA